MIQNLISATTFLAALASALAAYFWYRPSQVEAPKSLVVSVPLSGPAWINTGPLIEFAMESGRRNKVAALCSAAAAFFAGLSAILGLIH